MTAIVIVEGNTPASVARGQSGAWGFLKSLAGIAPAARVRIVNPHAAPVSAEDFARADGVIFTGSGEAWSTDAPEAAPQRAAMEAAFAAGRPVWGSCNGMQLAAVVLGGAVGASPRGIELGVARRMMLTGAGAAHPMMAGRRNGFCVPCIHRDEVQRLPHGAVLLAGNEHSPVQAFACETGGEDFWGAQYHPELAPADIAAYVRAGGVFSAHEGLADELEAAESDHLAAMRLGSSPAELVQAARTVELVNWVAHVEAARAGRAQPPQRLADVAAGPAMAGVLAAGADPRQG